MGFRMERRVLAGIPRGFVFRIQAPLLQMALKFCPKMLLGGNRCHMSKRLM